MENNCSLFKIGDIVKHYKGNYYQIIGFATHTETLETLIIYRGYDLDLQVATTKHWARPESMFNDIVDGCCTKRFTLINVEDYPNC